MFIQLITFALSLPLKLWNYLKSLFHTNKKNTAEQQSTLSETIPTLISTIRENTKAIEQSNTSLFEELSHPIKINPILTQVERLSTEFNEVKQHPQAQNTLAQLSSIENQLLVLRTQTEIRILLKRLLNQFSFTAKNIKTITNSLIENFKTQASGQLTLFSKLKNLLDDAVTLNGAHPTETTALLSNQEVYTKFITLITGANNDTEQFIREMSKTNP